MLIWTIIKIMKWCEEKLLNAMYDDFPIPKKKKV